MDGFGIESFLASLKCENYQKVNPKQLNLLALNLFCNKINNMIKCGDVERLLLLLPDVERDLLQARSLGNLAPPCLSMPLILVTYNLVLFACEIYHVT